MTHESKTTELAIRHAAIILGHGSREGRRQIVRFHAGEMLSLGVRAHVLDLLDRYDAADEDARAAMLVKWRETWEEYCGEALS